MQWGAARFMSVIVAAAVLVAAAGEPESTPKPADADEEKQWLPPEPPASKQRADERSQMVRRQIAEPSDGREPVEDKKVLEAMRVAPRHVFVSEDNQRWAYADSPLPIGHGQTISQPYIVALMTEQLALTPEKKVLEIGTGSGYQAAVLAQLTPHVYTIEIIEPLAKRSTEALAEQGYKDVKTRCADGYFGWEEHGPYDAIIVIPIGGPYEVQRLVTITKTEEGKRKSRTITAVRFVPLTRREQ